MPKTFFEVFNTLSVKDEIKPLLSGMEITKISANRPKTSLRIYLFGTRLIHKAELFTLEKEIASQLFPRQHMEIKIPSFRPVYRQKADGYLWRQHCR